MNSQVYLNPVRLSIVSIPRDKVWLFTPAILQILHEAVEKSDSYSDPGSDSESSDFEFSFSSSSDDEQMASSYFSSGSGSKRNLGTRTSLSKFDNSSKQESLTTIADLGEPDENYDQEDDYFFHVAYTPTECTVICSTVVSRKYFEKPLAVCAQLGYRDVVMLAELYLNLQVDTEGDFNNSERILELTQPLSAHKISLFFLLSHFTDIVLIPYHLKDQVVRILLNKKFEFSDVSNSYISSNPSPEDPVSPCESTSELEYNTQKLFHDAHIMPHIDKKVRLLLTGARPGEAHHAIVKAIQCVSSGKVPDYFAITRTSLNEILLILPGSSRRRLAMGFDFRSIIGSALDTIVPITIDLTKLPLDSTGIVAGLASRLITSIKSVPDTNSFEMSYLSMAQSAVLMIPRENLLVVSKMIKSMRSGLDDMNKEFLELQI